MAKQALDLVFDRLSRPVRFTGCDELIAHLPLVFPGWPVTPVSGHTDSPVLSVTRDGDGFRFDGYWLCRPLHRDDREGALSALVAEVTRAWVRDEDRLLCLHGAAVDIGGRLVVFPNQYRAGKSLLSACLAANGLTLFGDDVLPLDLADARGVAPGLAPRLRLPLPASLAPATVDFIDGHTALAGKHYAYLDLAADGLAARGSRLPVGAFVLLERADNAVTAFTPVSSAEVLKQVVWQNFAREADASTILGVLSGVVANAALFHLHYDRVEDAVELLRDHFANWPEANLFTGSGSRDLAAASDIPLQLGPGRYRRKAGIHLVEMDHQVFLADRQGAAIYHLNVSGGAVWSLLREPASFEEIVSLFVTAFPGLQHDHVSQDLADLIGEMLRRDLIEIGTGDPAQNNRGV